MNLSSEQLAEQCNVTRQAVSKWELNESVPDVDKIIQLSHVFNVSTDDLLFDSKKQLHANTSKPWSIDKVNQMIVLCTGMNVIGMVLIQWYQNYVFDTIFKVALMVQVISIILFEFLMFKVDNKDRNSVRKMFYGFNLFVFWVGPALLLRMIGFPVLSYVVNRFQIRGIMSLFYLSQFLIYGFLCACSMIIIKRVLKIQE